MVVKCEVCGKVIGHWENKAVRLCEEHLSNRLNNDSHFAKLFFKNIENLSYTGEWKAIDLWQGDD